MKKISVLLVLCLLVSVFPGAVTAEEAPVQPDAGDAVDIEVEGGIVSVESVGEISLDGEDLLLSDLIAPEDAEPEDIQEAPAEPETADPEGEYVANDAAEVGIANPGATPHVDPNGPQLAANEVTLGIGEAFELMPAMPAGSGATITLSSSAPAVASVEPSGRIAAVAVGDAVVTALASDGTYAECFVHVKLAPDTVSFIHKSFKIGKGETTDALKVVVGSVEGQYAGAYTLETSNRKIVAVTGDGSLKGVRTGKATVKVTTYNGMSASCKVTVVKGPGKISAKTDKPTLSVGETGSMSYTLPKNTASQVTYTSDNPAVVQVDAVTGQTLGVGVGKTKIRARTFNGKKASVTITVVAPPSYLAFVQPSVRLGVGMKVEGKTFISCDVPGAVSFSVADGGIASCSGGTLKGVAAGETILYATTPNGLTAQCPLSVTPAPKSVKLPFKTLEIGVKQSLKLEPDVGDSASTFTYSTSNKKIVKVRDDGTITGVKKGSATVTIQTYNKKKFKLKVKVVKSSSLTLGMSPESMELGVGETGTFKASYSNGIAASASYSSSNTAVAVVDAQSGVVTAVGFGEATITATTDDGKTAKAKVSVFGQPEWISVAALVELGEGQSHTLNVELSPGSRSPLYFTSQDPGVATVSADGVITGVSSGTTVVKVSTSVPSVAADVNVQVLPAPTSVSLAVTEQTLNVGETTQMNPSVNPGAVTTYSYSSSNEAVATVSDSGMVQAVSKGSAVLTVATHNGKTATLNLTVNDPWFPESIKLLNAPETMEKGEKLQLTWSVKPSDAVPDFQWKSSDEDVAMVDEGGVLYAVGYGSAKITAASKRNPAIVLEFTVTVGMKNVVLEIPARTTSIDGISKNLEKIDAIRVSAIGQIDMLESAGTISGSDASKRRSIVNNAFKDYAFPWMTLSKQVYWKKANSEGGAKDFKPNRVYYGIPYHSGSGTNREYNAAKALKENRYYDSGEGYYILNQKRLVGGSYCGNDCSCFVDAAIWGTNSGHSNDRTTEIAKSSDYKTIGDYGALRTGDLICKGGAHVVMFLYYTSAKKDQIMIIENGGIEPGTNTVHCIIMDVDWYTSRGYKIRRLKSLG